MELSEFGEFVEIEIRKIPEYNPRIILDEWQVMPYHIHLIIELGEYNYNNGIANVDDDNVIEIKQYQKQRRKMIIPKIMGKLKMKTPRLT